MNKKGYGTCNNYKITTSQYVKMGHHLRPLPFADKKSLQHKTVSLDLISSSILSTVLLNKLNDQRSAKTFKIVDLFSQDYLFVHKYFYYKNDIYITRILLYLKTI